MGYLKNLKKHTGKKIVAQALALAMCVTALQPVPVSYAAEETGSTGTETEWTFDNDEQGWKRSDNTSSDVGNTVSWDETGKRLKMEVDFSSAEAWHEASVEYEFSNALDVSAYKSFSFNLYYKETDKNSGSLNPYISVYNSSDSISSFFDKDGYDVSDKDIVKTTEGDLTKAECKYNIQEETANGKKLTKIKIAIKGNPVGFKGTIYIDDIKFSKVPPVVEEAPNEWTFDSDEQGWKRSDNTSSDVGNTVSWDETGKRLKMEVDFSSAEAWHEASVEYEFSNALDVSAYKSFSFNLYYKEADKNGGSLNPYISVYDSSGSIESFFEKDGYDVSGAEAYKEKDGDFIKATCQYKINNAVGKNLKKIKIAIKGDPIGFKGNIYIDNIQFSTDEVSDVPIGESMPSQWTFDTENDLGGWELSNNTKNDASLVWDNQRLKMSLKFKGTTDEDWPSASIFYKGMGNGLIMSPYKSLSFDLYYKESSMDGTKKRFHVKVMAEKDGQSLIVGNNTINISSDKSLDFKKEEQADGSIKATFQFDINSILAESVKPDKLEISITDNNEGGYNGDIYIDNIQLRNAPIDRGYEKFTVDRSTATKITSTNTEININGESKTYPTENIKLADPEANNKTKALYQYLKAVGESSSVIYGHMEDTVLKAGNMVTESVYSDTEDVTGSISAIDGLDCGSLFHGFAEKYIQRYPDDAEAKGITKDDSTYADDVKAAVELSKKSIEKGAIMTLSSHLPNFAYAVKKESTSEKRYDQYDYKNGDSYKLTGDCMNNILPGGKFNDPYTAYLDLIVDYAKGLDDEPILFRPLHENTGSWFWWGAAFCSPETYKSVFKYTVDYIREQGVHNLLYLYGPGSEAGSVEEYAERYPGDNYVDMVGFDSYDSNPKADDSYTFQQTLENTIKITSQFAKEHNKLFAVTETGIAHDEKDFNGQKALLLTNNERPEWYTEILNLVTTPGYNCCYFMLWSNYDTKSFYTPFVASKENENVLLGHELIDSFLKFYRDKRSIFATDQKDIVSKFSDIIVPETSDNELDGYMTYPIANSRILDATTFTARFNKELSDSQSVIIRMSGNGKEISINGVKNSSNGKIYNAELKAEDLKSLGEVLDGTISLYVDGKCYQTIDVIFNVEERKMLPEQVDDFESYSGLVNLLIGKWSAGKDSSSKIDLSLAKDPCYEGDYALKLAFTLAKNGYVGAEFSKEADWSSYNAIRFWVKPDGKNQKTVVQIKADGKGYEAYLNTYPDYANAKTPLLVTLPFSEFISNKGEPLTAATLKNMSNFSFWVNAIPESDVFKDSEEVYGELYYDDIRAVSAETDKPVFEAAEGKKPSEGTYTVKFDTSKVSNAMVAAKKNSEVFKTGGSVNAKDQLQFEITPADGYSVTSADVSVAGGTCKVSEAEKTANGVYIITLSEFTANTEATVNVKTEKAEVRENGTKAEENFGEANLSKTEFKDIQEDIKNNVKDALEKLVNSAPAGQEKEKAQEAIKAIENNEAFIDISLQVAKKTDDITEDEKTQNDIKVEDIRKEVQKNNSNADVEVKTAVTLDISLFSICKYTKNNEEIAKAAVKELTKPVKISMKLPDNIPAVKEGAKRIYYIICLHKNNDGKIEPSHVTCDYDENKGIISFDGSRFSTYVLCYADIVSKSASGSHTIGGGTAVILGSVTSTATPVPTAVPGTTPDTAASAAPTATAAPGSKPGTAASAAPITTPVPAATPSPDAVPSATGTPSATAKPSNTPVPSDKPGTPTSKVKKGTKFITKGTTYKVTSVSGTKTVTCIKFKKDIKKAVVPAAIKINDQKYKVTAIAKNAFKNNKKLTKVTIGKNVKSIGKNAFKGCKNLKKIIVKTKKLTAKKVGSKAFKGINSKAVVKVPKGKVKSYKKIVKAKGAGKKVKITK